MHELEDGFAAAVVFAVIVLIGIIVGALYAFRAGGSNRYRAADHGACLIARRGERHRARAGKVNCILRVVICIDNAISFCIQCQINSRILDRHISFELCRITFCSYIDGAVLNNQIAASICTDTSVA